MASGEPKSGMTSHFFEIFDKKKSIIIDQNWIWKIKGDYKRFSEKLCGKCHEKCYHFNGL